MTDVDHAVDALKQGGIVVMPTDTVYGVAVLPGYEDRIYALKGRDRSKPIPLLAAGIDDVEAFGAVIDDTARRLAARFWPGPLTMVLDAGDGTEGFRIPDHGMALELIEKAGGVLRVTSANISGEAPALSAEEAEAVLGEGVEAVLDAGKVTGGVPSTVISLAGGGRINILREGALDREALQEVIDE